MVEKYKYDKINDYFNPLFGKLYSLEDWPIEFYQDYIELMTGMYIPEVSVDEQDHVKKLLPIRYKKRLEKVINAHW